MTFVGLHVLEQPWVRLELLVDAERAHPYHPPWHTPADPVVPTTLTSNPSPTPALRISLTDVIL
jgi:hypothetical protein